jgi:hypothetical protein
MPKMTFSDDNRSKSSFDYPKFSLDSNERARVSAIEGAPEFQFVHTMRAPQIVNGRPVMETQTFKNKDGSEDKKEVMKTDFVGQHICIGDINVLSEKGADVTGCPVCKASKESDAVEAPRRRFAMHIIRYKTTAGTFNIQDPFNVDLAVWSFADKVFNVLIELTQQWGNLQERDLNLGPCINKMYQNFDVAMAAQCEWRASDMRQQQVATLYQNNKIEDLTVALGRRLSRDQIEEDLERVLTRYEIAMGRKGEAAISGGEATAQVDVGSILGTTGSTPSQATAETPATQPSQEISFGFPPADQKASEPAAASNGLNEFAPPKDESGKSTDKLNLDAILGL